MRWDPAFRPRTHFPLAVNRLANNLKLSIVEGRRWTRRSRYTMHLHCYLGTRGSRGAFEMGDYAELKLLAARGGAFAALALEYTMWSGDVAGVLQETLDTFAIQEHAIWHGNRLSDQMGLGQFQLV